MNIFEILTLITIFLIVISSILFLVKRRNLKDRLVKRREQIGMSAVGFPMSLRLIKDEIAFIESELAARNI